MFIKGFFDSWLDGVLGDSKTPNLPSRLVGCLDCNRIWHINRLDGSCPHTQRLVDETWINYFRSLLP